VGYLNKTSKVDTTHVQQQKPKVLLLEMISFVLIGTTIMGYRSGKLILNSSSNWFYLFAVK
jgi:hypothetical protein